MTERMIAEIVTVKQVPFTKKEAIKLFKSAEFREFNKHDVRKYFGAVAKTKTPPRCADVKWHSYLGDILIDDEGIEFSFDHYDGVNDYGTHCFKASHDFKKFKYFHWDGPETISEENQEGEKDWMF